MADPTVDFRSFNSKVDDLITALNKNTEALDQKGTGAGGTGDADKMTDGQKKVIGALQKLSTAVFDITEELTNSGRALARTIGTTLTDGIRLESQARANFASQVFRYGVNFAATVEQIQAVQKSAADAFVNVPEGFQLSSDATAEFASGLKRIFGGEFELTSNTLRNFGALGLTSLESIEQFKNSTGRAGFSTQQYERIINRNIPSLLIFGQSAARSAINLDRIGISLEQYRAVQQGVVTNLEGTLDTVNQLNQLGATIDFSSFVRISELEGPEAAFRYLDQNIPDALLKTSTSFRALTEQLPGVKVEDLLRGGMEPAVATLEQQLLDISGPDGALAGFASALGTTTQAIQKSTGNTALPLLGAAGGALGASLAGTLGLSATFAATGGAILLPLLAMGAASLFAGDDVVSSYGDRTLVTPKGNIALNNNDTVIAGTNLMPRGSVQMADNSALMSKIDRFIDTVSSATTTINVDGTQRTVPRMSLVGVYSRNERA